MIPPRASATSAGTRRSCLSPNALAAPCSPYARSATASGRRPKGAGCWRDARSARRTSWRQRIESKERIGSSRKEGVMTRNIDRTAALNRLLNLERFSLANYLQYARPLVRPGDEALHGAVQQIARDQLGFAQRTVQLIERRKA